MHASTAGEVPLFGIFEARTSVHSHSSDPFGELYVTRFWQPGKASHPIHIHGFYDSRDHAFVVRFSPASNGSWKWTATNDCTLPELRLAGGDFEVGKARDGDHGPVRAQGTHFVHADGTEHFSVGTTSYAWIHQSLSLRRQTLGTLAGRGSAFNKLRMTIFPKWYVYNQREPSSALYPFVGKPPRGWEYPLQFEPAFWENLDNAVNDLRLLGVQADLILFHPYDAGHWGFACLGESTPAGYDIKHDLRYLRYVVSRLGAFSNVWWSMANEFDYIPCKHTSHWVTLFNELRNLDSHGHLASIHNGPDRGAPFERSNHPAISHHSVQLNPSWGRSRRIEYTRSLLQGAFGGSQKPVVWDECQYEGDLPRDWAKLSSAAMSTRFWDGFMLGVYVGHSEALLGGAQWQDGEPVLWWSKGGALRGGSPPIIGQFKQWVEDGHHPTVSLLEPIGKEETARIAFWHEDEGRWPYGWPGHVVLALRGHYALFDIPSGHALPTQGNWSLTLPGAPTDACLVASAVDRATGLSTSINPINRFSQANPQGGGAESWITVHVSESVCTPPFEWWRCHPPPLIEVRRCPPPPPLSPPNPPLEPPPSPPALPPTPPTTPPSLPPNLFEVRPLDQLGVPPALAVLSATGLMIPVFLFFGKRLPSCEALFTSRNFIAAATSEELPASFVDHSHSLEEEHDI